MIDLIIDNIFIEVRGASKEVEYKLWDVLSFTVKEFNMSPNYHPTIRHLFNRKTKLTYTGLLPYIIDLFDDMAEEYQIIDNRKKPVQNANFNLVPYLDEQKTIPLKLRDYQQDIVDRLQDRDIIQACTSSGKALTVNTLILTPNGFVPMKDIRINDIVYDELGKETRVIGEYPQGVKDVHEVTFEDGSKIKCCIDHLWKIITENDSKLENRYRTLSTKQLMQEIKNKSNLGIPINKPIQFTKKELLLHPYVLGLLLGHNNWTTNSFININNMINKLNSINGDKNIFTHKLYEIFNKYQFGKKIIPKEYLYSSIDDRLQLMQGLIDISNAINKDGYIVFNTSSVQLKNDFIWLAHSLGYRVIVKENIDNYDLIYEICICNSDILKIIDIKKLDYQEEMKCIAVDSPLHTYICENFIVTHNTIMMAGAIAKFNTKPVAVCADKISLCQQLQGELSKFLGEKVGLVGNGFCDQQDITVYSVQSVAEDMIKDTKVLMIDECFTEDTVIQLTNGIKKTIGWLVNSRDTERTYRVVSFNIETGERENKTITHFFKIPCNKQLFAVLVKVNEQIIKLTCTGDHLFYIKSFGYKQVNELQENDEIIAFINNELKSGVIFKVVQTPQKPEFVYDIEVEDNHNFFANGVLVHNCHHTPANTVAQVARWCQNAYYRIGLSATPWREDGADLLIDAVFSRRDPSLAISASDLIEKNYLVKPIIYWVHQREIFKNKNYQNLYNEAIVNNMTRNQHIVTIAYQMRKSQDATILILVQRVEHGNILLNMLYDIFERKQSIVTINDISREVNNIEFLSGQDDMNRRLAVLQGVKEKKCRILIATTIADEGLDLPILNCLILAGSGKSSTRALQRIGRVVRLYTDQQTGQEKKRAIVFDFMDYSPMLKRHSQIRNRLYKKEPLWDIQDFPAKLLLQKPPKLQRF